MAFPRNFTAITAAFLSIAQSVSAADQVKNGSFDSDLEGWWGTQNISLEHVDGKVCADVPGGTVNPWDVIIGQDDVALEKGEAYDFTFTAEGAPGGPVRALVQMNESPWTDYISTVVQATTAAETKLSFRSVVDNPVAQVVFQVGGSKAPWRVCLDEVHVLGGAAIQAYRPDVGGPIRVNQFGYLPDGPKRATMVTDKSAPMGWTLRDASGKVLERGQTVVQALDASSGLNTHLIDFSATPQVGAGFMIGADGKRSHPFDITPDLYAGLTSDALAYFYPVRSGIEIDGALAGAAYARPAGHIGLTPNNGDTAVPCQAPDSSQAAYGTPWTCDYTLDVTGGWYDAGDHGKYVVNGGISVGQILAAYERRPDAFTDGGMAIPEAGNGTPDILDEVRWELDFMLKMVVPEGQPLAGLYHHKIHDDEWTGLPLMPHLDAKTRSLHRPSTAATLNVAAVFATGARLYRPYDGAYADRLLAAARAAYAAAVATPDLYATPEDGAMGGGPYDDTKLADEFFWAAAELYLTTGEAEFLAAVENAIPAQDIAFGPAAFDWGTVWALPIMNLVSVESDLPNATKDALKAQIIAAADAYVATTQSQAFGQNYAPKDAKYEWGSNHLHLQNAIVMGAAHDLTGDGKYRDAILGSMDYIFGRNALNISYITGYGTHFAQNQHSRWFAAQVNPDLPHPPKGSLAGGPNSSIQDPVAQRLLTDCAAQFCYIDDIESWSTNEITINWNAALVQIASVLADL